MNATVKRATTMCTLVVVDGAPDRAAALAAARSVAGDGPARVLAATGAPGAFTFTVDVATPR